MLVYTCTRVLVISRACVTGEDLETGKHEALSYNDCSSLEKGGLSRLGWLSRNVLGT